MYSFSETIDYSSSHTGFYIAAGIVAVIMLFHIKDILLGHDDADSLIFPVIFFSAVLGFGYLASYGDKSPRNEQVIATFEGVSPELEVRGSGRHKTITHTLYGRFKTPEGIVMLPVQQGVAIPPRVILYKN